MNFTSITAAATKIQARFRGERVRNKQLSTSAIMGDIKFVNALIKAGANVNAKNIFSRTPIMQAACKGHKGIIQLLLDNRADVNIKIYNSCNTALMMAVMLDHKDIVDLLVKAGANVNARDCMWMTALGQAACHGHIDIAKALIKAGANLNAKDKYGYPVLYSAAYERKAALVTLLVKKGADTSIVFNHPTYNDMQSAIDEGKEALINTVSHLKEFLRSKERARIQAEILDKRTNFDHNHKTQANLNLDVILNIRSFVLTPRREILDKEMQYREDLSLKM